MTLRSAARAALAPLVSVRAPLTAPAALVALAALAGCSDLSFVALEEEPERSPRASTIVRWLHLDSLTVQPAVVLLDWAADSPQVRFGDMELPLVWQTETDASFRSDGTLSAESLVGPVPLILPASAVVEAPIELDIPLLRRVGERRVCDDGTGAVALTTRAEPSTAAPAASVSWALIVDADRDPEDGLLSVSWGGRGYPGTLRVPTVALPDADTLSALLELHVRLPASHTDVAMLSTSVVLRADWEIVLAPEGACDAMAP